MICASKHSFILFYFFYREYEIKKLKKYFKYYYSFPGATNETLLQKFNSVHKDNTFYEKPQKKENAFIIQHYAGKVKYQVC